jgi:hypothetical protein
VTENTGGAEAQERTWVMAANGATAFIYGAAEDGERLELVTDGLFLRYEGNLEPSDTQARQQEFFQHVLAWLAAASETQRFSRLILAAPTTIAPTLKAGMPPALAAKIAREIHLDLTRATLTEIESHVGYPRSNT